MQALNLHQLRQFIGREVEFQGQTCCVIEVLEEGPALVLSCTHGAKVIQPNQHGDAARRVPRTCSIPVFTQDRQHLHPDFMSLGLS